MSIQFKKKIFLKIALVLSLLLMKSPVVFAPTTQEWDGYCVYEMNIDGTPTNIPTIQGLQCALANVLSVFIAIVGVGGFVMLIFGSIKLMLSGSSSGGAEQAQKTMTFAIVGIVVTLSSFIILNLIGSFTGVSIIEKFIIPNWDKIWT